LAKKTVFVQALLIDSVFRAKPGRAILPNSGSGGLKSIEIQTLAYANRMFIVESEKRDKK